MVQEASLPGRARLHTARVEDTLRIRSTTSDQPLQVFMAGGVPTRGGKRGVVEGSHSVSV